MSRPIRVGHIAGEPTASRVPQLDLIARRPEIDLTVVYCAQTIQRRLWELEIDHPAVFLDGPTLPTSWLLQHDYPITPSVWGLLQRKRFDCLVIGGWSVFGAQLAIVWARSHRVPYVLFAESHLGERRRAWVRGLKRAIVPLVVRPAAAHLVPGTLAREHELAYGARRDRIWIFPNTVDVDAYIDAAARIRDRRAAIRERLGLAPDAFVVLGVNRLISVKGVDTLVDAVAAAAGATDVPLQLLVVGDGPERAAIVRQAAARGVNATFTGFLQGEALLQAYAAADVFALLSRRETWGIVVNEAMAFGLPLVLSEGVGAAVDLLLPDENGCIVPVGDAQAAGAAIARLASDAGLQARYGARSRELIGPWGYGPSVDAYVTAVTAAVAA